MQTDGQVKEETGETRRLWSPPRRPLVRSDEGEESGLTTTSLLGPSRRSGMRSLVRLCLSCEAAALLSALLARLDLALLCSPSPFSAFLPFVYVLLLKGNGKEGARGRQLAGLASGDDGDEDGPSATGRRREGERGEERRDNFCSFAAASSAFLFSFPAPGLWSPSLRLPAPSPLCYHDITSP